MSSVFFFSLLLFQIEPALLISLALRSAGSFSLNFNFFTLHLQRLPGLRSYAGNICLLPRFARYNKYTD